MHGGKPVMHQGQIDPTGELQLGGQALAGDRAHPARRRHHVVGCDRPPVGAQAGGDAQAASEERLRAGQEVAADVHDAVAAVVALATRDGVDHVADQPVRDRGRRRPRGRADAALVVDRYLHAALARAAQDRVGLLQIDADRLLHVDVVRAVVEHPHHQLVVELGAGRNRDDLRLHGVEHRLNVGEPGGDAELVSQGLQPLGVEVTQPHQLGAGVFRVAPADGDAAGAATDQRRTIRDGHHVCSPASGWLRSASGRATRAPASCDA